MGWESLTGSGEFTTSAAGASTAGRSTACGGASATLPIETFAAERRAVLHDQALDPCVATPFNEPERPTTSRLRALGGPVIPRLEA